MVILYTEMAVSRQAHVTHEAAHDKFFSMLLETCEHASVEEDGDMNFQLRDHNSEKL